MDDTLLVSADIAPRKARTAVRFRRDTKLFFDQVEAGHPFVTTLDPNLVASPGGLPIIVDRRQFMTLLGGAASWPLAARAQQAALPVVGVLYSGTADGMAPQITALRRTLNEAGYVEGRNISFEIRVAENRLDRLPALARDLVQRRVAVIYSAGGVAPALAAKAATSTIPIVFGLGSDPVDVGLVNSFNRPGGNITGGTVVSDVLRSKQVELLHGIVPSAADFAFLANPATPRTKGDVADMEAAAHALGWQMKVFNARNEDEFPIVFAEIADQRVRALLIQDNALFNSHPGGLADSR